MERQKMAEEAITAWCLTISAGLLGRGATEAAAIFDDSPDQRMPVAPDGFGFAFKNSTYD